MTRSQKPAKPSTASGHTLVRETNLVLSAPRVLQLTRRTGAGVPYQANNVTTDWPTGGGSLKLELHHAWTYVFVNLGLGTNVTNFNVSLTPQFWNVTGKGTLCVDKLAVPVNVSDGALASLQVVTVGDSGNALYNCADIRFKNDAKTLSNCTTTPGIKVNFIKDQTGNGSTSGNSSTGGSSGGGSNGTSGSGSNQGGAGVVDANMLALFTVVALASGLAMGL